MISIMSDTRSRAHASRIDTGLALLAGGETVQAEAIFREILAVDVECAGAWHGLACVARALGQPRVAIASAAQALQLEKNDREKSRFHITLAAALDEAGHLREAVSACRVALLLEPRDFRGKAFLAELLHRSGQGDEAEREFREALALAADPASLLARRGAFLMAQRDFVTASETFKALIARLSVGAGYDSNAGHARDADKTLRQAQAAAYANLGAACFEAGAMSEALTALQTALSLDVPSAQTLNNLGLVYHALGAFAQAESLFTQALSLAPDDAGIKGNHATLLAETGREREAEQAFCAVPQPPSTGTAPNDAAGTLAFHRARFNLGVLQLARGDYAQGWANFEHRLALTPLPSDLPRWSGEETAQRVCIQGEQGLGDALQFLRFVPRAAERAPLLLSIPAPLQGLLRAMPSLTPLLRSGRVVLEGEAALFCPMLSLPYVLGAEHIDTKPILDLGVVPEPGRVGIFHAGSPTYRFNARRSLPVSMLAPLVAVPGYEFVSFQAEGERAAAPAFGMAQGVGPTLLDTAREMARCELIIGVDSLLAHVAGSAGMELWLLDRVGGDWRWQGPDWYARTRVFRPVDHAPPAEAWPVVVTRVAQALRDRGSEKQAL